MLREFYKFKLFEKQNQLAWIVLSRIILIRFITDFHIIYRLKYSNYYITNALTTLKNLLWYHLEKFQQNLEHIILTGKLV